MFSAIPGAPTGLAMAVLNRTKGFLDNGINSVILAPAFNRFHTRDMNLLRQKGLLEVPVNYMFEDLSESDNKVFLLPDPVSKLIENENLVSISDDNPLIKRLFDDGKYEYFVKYNSKGGLDFVKHFYNQVFVDKTSYYNENNILVVEEFYFPNSNTLLSKVYYDNKGKAFLRYLYKKNGELYNIIHFPSGKTFKDEQELVFFWLSKILPKNEIIMLISEYAVYKDALISAKKQLMTGSKLIFTLHNNHYSAPYTIGSPVRNDFKPILNHLDELKNIVVLTEEQQKDLIDQFQRTDTFFHVPHATKQLSISKKLKRTPLTITIGSRFEKIKGIDETIYAFSKVLKEIAGVHLNIIGRGVEKKNYESLIKSLGVEQQVSIIDFVNDLPLEYAKSDISVFTSQYEGFHLSLIEAMSAGAVPVVFPYKYGPKDIIENGKSGIITRKRDVDELANEIVGILTNRERLSEMRKETLKVSKKFSVKNNVEHWNNVFHNAR